MISDSWSIMTFTLITFSYRCSVVTKKYLSCQITIHCLRAIEEIYYDFFIMIYYNDLIRLRICWSFDLAVKFDRNVAFTVHRRSLKIIKSFFKFVYWKFILNEGSTIKNFPTRLKRYNVQSISSEINIWGTKYTNL